MEKRVTSEVMLALLLTSMLTLVVSIQPVKASGTIYIRADGSVEGTDKIQRDGNIYTFTDNIYDSIVVQRDNIVVDGAGYVVQGTGVPDSIGIDLSMSRSNVTIKNTQIKAFETGIAMYSSFNNTISANNIITNIIYGIALRYSNNNTISGNSVTATPCGILLGGSKYNTILGNTLADNHYGIWIPLSGTNKISHNNFIDNDNQVVELDYTNIWDDGYPSGGNYWSDYTDVDLYGGPSQDMAGSDGRWDHPYIIDAGNQDRYPFTQRDGWETPPTTNTLIITATVGGTTNPTPGTYTYSQGQNVPVQAIPSSGYYLSHWELDGLNVGNELTYTVTMDAPHALTASFAFSGPGVPEFPLYSAMYIAAIPLLFYIWWKRKQGILR